MGGEPAQAVVDQGQGLVGGARIGLRSPRLRPRPGHSNMEGKDMSARMYGPRIMHERARAGPGELPTSDRARRAPADREDRTDKASVCMPDQSVSSEAYEMAFSVVHGERRKTRVLCW